MGQKFAGGHKRGRARAGIVLDGANRIGRQKYYASIV
jgi:hypothetical protein